MCERIADETLLASIDGELPRALADKIDRHLEECLSCRTRYRALCGASNDASDVLGFAGQLRDVPTVRLRLAAMMTTDADRRRSRRMPVVLALTAAVLFLTVRYESGMFERSRLTEIRALPRPSFTPGLAENVSVDEVCRAGPRIPPRVPSAVRSQVLHDYGMEHVPETEYELDYLITPELGGLTDRRNLWPEPYGLRAWNAHAKDALETVLPQMVCSGRIDLATAQREIAANWIAAYKKYLEAKRPVQLHARVFELPHSRSPIGN